MSDILLRNIDDNYILRRYRDMGDGTHALVGVGDLPADLMTARNGANRRLKVNSGVGAAAVVGVHNYRWEER